jgi:hypothetical protein
VVWFCFDIWFWNCSDSVIFDSAIVPTMCMILFLYLILELFRQCGMNLFWYLVLELYRQCGMILFFILYICFSCICNNVSDSMTVTRENRKTFTTRLLFSCFHKLLKTFPTFYYRYRNLVYRCNSTCRYLIKKGNLPSIFYGDIINKAKQFKYDTSELVKYLKIFIRIGYNLAVRVHSLMQDYFTKNIDNLLGQTGNYISFHIILRFQYLIPTNWWCICSVLPRTPSMFLDVHD